MGYVSGYDVDRWRAARRLSLAESARCANGRALAEARNFRLQRIWLDTAVELAESGADVRPLLANLPGLAPAAEAARTLTTRAAQLCERNPEDLTLAASHFVQAGRFFERAGFEQEAAACESEAFACVQDAVYQGTIGETSLGPSRWLFDKVYVSAPPRIDLGGGWSDTPPFCFDWGGTVLNC